ncbi:hypothetical protein CDL12_19698 [Handroanthus impetiginosus]|uniref:F-box domain-containing protein n=1 Tax=Handroanthus impetiginosus TaxID=429701 RepID=A0A2G9GR94_9LAMI|nr:hypothetical protein CDL12_19698 [Handroanthus impetiginosus]
MKLSTDLVSEIFFRLECKDIVSCRGVCRAWYNFLSDPNFSINYTRYSSFTTLLTIPPYSCYSDYFYLIHVTTNGEFIRRSIKPKIPRTLDRNLIVYLIDSCNGLALLQLRTCYNYDHARVFKAVYLCNLLLGGALEAHILTFGEDDKWRKVEDSLTFLSNFTHGASFNGTYHWVAEDKIVGRVCTFDFGEEKFGRIPKPHDLLYLSCKMEITVLNNHLCLVEFVSSCGDMTIWTMKKYGVAESWSKDIVLRCWIPYTSFHGRCPLEMLPNGDILFLKYGSRGLLYFSRKTKLCIEVPFGDADPVLYRSCVTAYAPTFYALVEDVNGQIH